QRYSQEEARKILGLGPKIPVLLFFGYVRKYKGLHYLLQAIPEVMRKLPQVHLLVVGEFYEPVAPYQELIEHLGIKAHVTLVDQYIPNEEIGLYFAAADVVVLPYVSATQSGIVQIAYNFNKPVITTDVGGLPEVVRDGVTGFVVPAQNYQALARAIINYFEQNKEQEFVKNMQHQKEQYSWERLVTAIEEFMKKVG
ncbi:glycosyl transferase family 1, partial [candidate division KSB1 bacterium]